MNEMKRKRGEIGEESRRGKEKRERGGRNSESLNKNLKSKRGSYFTGLSNFDNIVLFHGSYTCALFFAPRTIPRFCDSRLLARTHVILFIVRNALYFISNQDHGHS